MPVPLQPPTCVRRLWSGWGTRTCWRSTPGLEVDRSALAAEVVTVVLQVNGKVREQLEMPAGLSKEALQEQVLAHEAVAARLAGKEILKVIAVPDKLVNVVVKP